MLSKIASRSQHNQNQPEVDAACRRGRRLTLDINIVNIRHSATGCHTVAPLSGSAHIIRQSVLKHVQDTQFQHHHVGELSSKFGRSLWTGTLVEAKRSKRGTQSVVASTQCLVQLRREVQQGRFLNHSTKALSWVHDGCTTRITKGTVTQLLQSSFLQVMCSATAVTNLDSQMLSFEFHCLFRNGEPLRSYRQLEDKEMWHEAWWVCCTDGLGSFQWVVPALKTSESLSSCISDF